MRKLIIYILACAATILTIYFLSVILRSPKESMEDTPVSDTFTWMEEVHSNGQNK